MSSATIIASSFRAYEDYNFPKSPSFFGRIYDYIRLRWELAQEKDPVRREMLRNIIQQRKAGKREERRTKPLKKMVFRHGAIISHPHNRVHTGRGPVSVHVEDLERTADQAVLSRLPARTAAQRLEETRQKANLDSLMLMNAISRRGEELRRHVKDGETERSGMRLCDLLLEEMQAGDPVIDALVSARNETSAQVKELERRTCRNQLARRLMFNTVMKKHRRSPSLRSFEEY